LHDEQDNLRTALTWAATSGQAESGLRLAATLGLFWLVHGDYSEGRTRLATLLNQPGATTPPSGATRAAALHWAGALAYYQGDYPASRVLLKESLTLRRQAGEKPVDERGIAETLVWLVGRLARDCPFLLTVAMVAQ
jgi:hypothetical protein